MGIISKLFCKAAAVTGISLGTRPYYLMSDMKDSPLKTKLESCKNMVPKKSSFSIGHRGACLEYPEHTKESYEAAARMGAGVLECDVTFTKDKELVCRHSQCDLHTSTNILNTTLVSKCTVQPNYTSPTPFKGVLCCTSDITLTEYKTLKGKMDGGNSNAATLTDYFNSIPRWRTTLSAGKGTLLSHKESIELFKSLNVMMTPELKGASVPMPYDGFTQEMYAQKMIDEYKAAGVNAKNVWAQSFDHSDVRYWVKNEPTFGKQAVALEDVNVDADLVAATARLAGLKTDGVQIVAPPTWALLSLDASKNIVPSAYATAIKNAGLKIITWTLERSGPIRDIASNSYYYQNILGALSVDGDYFAIIDVLAQQVGVIGIFSDWAATVTYYANCFKLK